MGGIHISRHIKPGKLQIGMKYDTPNGSQVYDTKVERAGGGHGIDFFILLLTCPTLTKMQFLPQLYLKFNS